MTERIPNSTKLSPTNANCSACTSRGRIRLAISAVRALAYFEHAEALPLPRIIDRTPWPAMKRFLERRALEAGRKRLGDLWE